VIYDKLTHDAHQLSPTAAMVWRLADGTQSVPELAAGLRTALAEARVAHASTLDARTGEDLVQMALAELDRVGLLASRVPSLGEPISRREMMGITAALLPAIASIVAPTPAMAQTFPFTTTTSSTTTTVPSGSLTSFNGTYNGSGVPGTVNTCELSPRPVSITLTFPATGNTGSMTITHISEGSSVVFNSPVVTAVPAGSNSITVTGPGSTGPSGYQSTNNITFSLTGVGTLASASGAQQITYITCPTGSTYNITAARP
jgi:hypothetical protein